MAGKTDLTRMEASEQLSKAKSITTHPQYNPNEGQYDAAIIKLSVPLCFDDFVQPIPLAPPGMSPTGNPQSSTTNGLTLNRINFIFN